MPDSVHSSTLAPSLPRGSVARNASAPVALEPPQLSNRQKLLRLAAAIAAVALLAWAFRGAEIAPLSLLTNWDNMVSYASGFAQPDFRYWPDYAAEMLTTIHVALWGTVLAVFAAIPFALLSSSNVAPFWIRQLTRRAMDTLRSINELVFALLFVAAIGLGPFAGVLALFLHNLGTLSKLFSEAVEAIDDGPLEGVRATGAGKLAEIVFGVIPQCLPLWISYTLYRFESNVRSATVLGMIGAGGIGMPLHESIRGFDYGQTATILIIIVVAVSLIDMASSQARKAFL